MSKIIAFSTKFPSYHINKGKPPFFVEKILNGLKVGYKDYSYFQKLLVLNAKNIDSGKLTIADINDFWTALEPIEETKLHTIRVGKRFKLGEKFSPRIWSGRPYFSPQIIFFDDLEIQYCPDFLCTGFYGDKNNLWLVNSRPLASIESIDLAIGDGLKYADMLSWFNKPFHGQIICWSKLVNYVGEDSGVRIELLKKIK